MRKGPGNRAIRRRPSSLNRWRLDGQLLGRSKISRYGNARLRWTLWLASQAAVLKPANSFRDKFERYIAQDRYNPDLRRKAYTSIAAKMARTVHAVIKSGEPHRPSLPEQARAEGPPSVEPWRRQQQPHR